MLKICESPWRKFVYDAILCVDSHSPTCGFESALPPSALPPIELKPRLGKMGESCRFRDNRDFRHVGPPHANARERGYAQGIQGDRVMQFLEQGRP